VKTAQHPNELKLDNTINGVPVESKPRERQMRINKTSNLDPKSQVSHPKIKLKTLRYCRLQKPRDNRCKKKSHVSLIPKACKFGSRTRLSGDGVSRIAWTAGPSPRTGNEVPGPKSQHFPPMSLSCHFGVTIHFVTEQKEPTE
jgi:hypothetical protein